MEISHEEEPEASPPHASGRNGGRFAVLTLLGVVAGLVLLVALNMK